MAVKTEKKTRCSLGELKKELKADIESLKLDNTAQHEKTDAKLDNMGGRIDQIFIMLGGMFLTGIAAIFLDRLIG